MGELERFYDDVVFFWIQGRKWVFVCVGVTCNLKPDIVHVHGQLYWTSSTSVSPPSLIFIINTNIQFTLIKSLVNMSVWLWPNQKCYRHGIWYIRSPKLYMKTTGFLSFFRKTMEREREGRGEGKRECVPVCEKQREIDRERGGEEER